MIDFLVFGVTGRTGAAFARQALAEGHRVAALVRDRAAVVPAGVAVTVGDVLDAAAVDAAVGREQVIVVTLGGAAALTTGCSNVIRAAASAGARRVLGVVGAGVLQADAGRLRHERPDYPAQLHAIGAAHRAFYEALRASPLEWTLACTPRLLDGGRTHALRSMADYLPDGTGSVTTEDVAAFLLEEAVHPRFMRARVGLNGMGARP
jgi:putative NADH-flavin reductase